MKKLKTLTPAQANRFALEMQVVKIKCAEAALKNRQPLWGHEIDSTYINRLKQTLQELDRKQQLFTSGKYERMPYLPSGISVVDKIKDHFADDERYAFTEVRQGTSGKMIVTHTHSKSFITKQIKQKQKQKLEKMATKKKAAAAKKTAKKVNKSTTSKTQGDSIKSFVDSCVKKKMDNAAIFAALDKAGYAYSINSVRWYASKARGGK